MYMNTNVHSSQGTINTTTMFHITSCIQFVLAEIYIIIVFCSYSQWHTILQKKVSQNGN